MFYLPKKQKHLSSGVSLVEVLVATVIFSITAVGTYSVLSMSRTTSNVSERSVQAAYYGRQLLDELRGKVSQESWNAWYLDCDGTSRNWPTNMAGTPFFDDFGGSANYTCQDTALGLRQVNLIITWDEP